MGRDYDVAVVGAGIGGLACAALLSHAGLETIVLEKNSFLGGRCVSYRKRGCVIDAFIHMFASCEKGPFGKILRRAEMPDAIRFWHVDPSNKPVLILHGKSYVYPDLSFATEEDMKNTLRGLLLPEQDYRAALRLNGDLYAMPEEETHELDNVSYQDWLERYSHHEALMALHNHRTMLMGVVGISEASAGEVIRMTQSWHLRRNLGYPFGGCQAIPDGFAKIIRHHGGEIRTKAPTSKVLVAEGAAAGVELASGETINARAVVSNAGLKETAREMVPRGILPREYLDHVGGLSCGIFGTGEFMRSFLNIKVLLDEPVIAAPVVFGVPLPAGRDAIGDGAAGDPESRSIDQFATFMPIPSNMDPSLVPEGRQLLNFPGMALPGTKDPSACIDEQLDLLEVLHPGIKSHVLWTDVIAGEAVKGYSGRYQSDVVGLAQIVGQVGRDRPSPQSPLPGLFYVGADVGKDHIGTELAAESALRTAAIVEDFLGG